MFDERPSLLSQGFSLLVMIHVVMCMLHLINMCTCYLSQMKCTYVSSEMYNHSFRLVNDISLSITTWGGGAYISFLILVNYLKAMLWLQ